MPGSAQHQAAASLALWLAAGKAWATSWLLASVLASVQALVMLSAKAWALHRQGSLHTPTCRNLVHGCRCTMPGSVYCWAVAQGLASAVV
mmetsp:Transcript_88940/g.223815  ORF Transcript_88940/g.223815 Transcript_88940/m.223815 type:complete len:90 (-) Transcript_88940:3050-3319(-)